MFVDLNLFQVSFSELLQIEANKDKLEQHLMEIILENPNEAAETLAGLFAHDNQVKNIISETQVKVFKKKIFILVSVSKKE